MLIYDRDRGSCASTARWLQERLPEGYVVIAHQDLPDPEALGLTPAEVSTTLHWIGVDGTAHRGHRAVGRALIACEGTWAIAGWLLVLPPLSWVAAGLYRVLSRQQAG